MSLKIHNGVVMISIFTPFEIIFTLAVATKQ